jgi:hypothetical protein
MPKTIVYSDEEKIRRYTNRVRWAERQQKRWFDQVKVFLTYYRNKPQIYTKGGQRVIVPTPIKNIDAMFAALTSFEVEPAISGRGHTDRDAARVANQAVKFEWADAKVAERSEHAIKEALIAGIGYMKVSYAYDEDVQTIESYTEDPETGEIVPDPLEQVTVTEDRVIVEHVPYDEVFFDPEAKKWEDVTWIAQRMELPLESLQEDDSFIGTQDLQADSIIARENKTRGGEDATPDEQRCVIFAIWDFETGTCCYFSPSNKKILKETANPFAKRLDMEDRNPFVPFITRRDINGVVGISDMQVMKPSIDEQNVLRSNLATFVDRFKPKILAEQGVITDQGKKAIKSQEWGEIVELQNGAILNNSMKPLEIPELPQEAFMQDGKAADDAQESIGLNELMQGLIPAGRKTAAAMNMYAQATTIRQAEKRNQLERFYRKLAERMLYIMQRFYELPRIQKIVDIDADVIWNWEADDLNVDLGLTVDLQPRQVMDQQGKEEKMMKLMNILGQDQRVNHDTLIKYVLEELDIPPEIIRDLIQMPSPADQQMAGEAAQAAVGLPGVPQLPPAEDQFPGAATGSALGELAGQTGFTQP